MKTKSSSHQGLQSRSRFLNPGIQDWGISNPGITPGLQRFWYLNPGIKKTGMGLQAIDY